MVDCNVVDDCTSLSTFLDAYNILTSSKSQKSLLQFKNDRFSKTIKGLLERLKDIELVLMGASEELDDGGFKERYKAGLAKFTEFENERALKEFEQRTLEPLSSQGVRVVNPIFETDEDPQTSEEDKQKLKSFLANQKIEITKALGFEICRSTFSKKFFAEFEKGFSVEILDESKLSSSPSSPHGVAASVVAADSLGVRGSLTNFL